MAFAALALVLIARDGCDGDGVSLTAGTPREELCSSLPAGGAWWLLPGVLPVAVVAAALLLRGRRRVPGATAALAVVLAVAYVVVLTGLRGYPPSP